MCGVFVLLCGQGLGVGGVAGAPAQTPAPPVGAPARGPALLGAGAPRLHCCAGRSAGVCVVLPSAHPRASRQPPQIRSVCGQAPQLPHQGPWKPDKPLAVGCGCLGGLTWKGRATLSPGTEQRVGAEVPWLARSAPTRSAPQLSSSTRGTTGRTQPCLLVMAESWPERVTDGTAVSVPGAEDGLVFTWALKPSQTGRRAQPLCWGPTRRAQPGRGSAG